MAFRPSITRGLALSNINDTLSQHKKSKNAIGKTLIFDFKIAEIKLEKKGTVLLTEKLQPRYIVVWKMSKKFNLYQIVQTQGTSQKSVC